MSCNDTMTWCIPVPQGPICLTLRTPLAPAQVRQTSIQNSILMNIGYFKKHLDTKHLRVPSDLQVQSSNIAVVQECQKLIINCTETQSEPQNTTNTYTRVPYAIVSTLLNWWNWTTTRTSTIHTTNKHSGTHRGCGATANQTCNILKHQWQGGLVLLSWKPKFMRCILYIIVKEWEKTNKLNLSLHNYNHI